MRRTGAVAVRGSRPATEQQEQHEQTPLASNRPTWMTRSTGPPRDQGAGRHRTWVQGNTPSPAMPCLEPIRVRGAERWSGAKRYPILALSLRSSSVTRRRHGWAVWIMRPPEGSRVYLVPLKLLVLLCSPGARREQSCTFASRTVSCQLLSALARRDGRQGGEQEARKSRSGSDRQSNGRTLSRKSKNREVQMQAESRERAGNGPLSSNAQVTTRSCAQAGACWSQIRRCMVSFYGWAGTAG